MRFCNHAFDFRPNCTRLSAITIIYHSENKIILNPIMRNVNAYCQTIVTRNFAIFLPLSCINMSSFSMLLTLGKYNFQLVLAYLVSLVPINNSACPKYQISAESNCIANFISFRSFRRLDIALSS